MRISVLSLICSVVWSVNGSLEASIIVSGTPNQNGGTGTIQITTDVSFNITSTDGAVSLIIDEWVNSDGGPAAATMDDLSYQINGGPIKLTTGTAFQDEASITQGNITPNDGLIAFDSIAVSAGDILTIKSGSFDFPGHVAMNAGLLGTFTGDLFLVNASTQRYQIPYRQSLNHMPLHFFAQHPFFLFTDLRHCQNVKL